MPNAPIQRSHSHSALPIRSLYVIFVLRHPRTSVFPLVIRTGVAGKRGRRYNSTEHTTLRAGVTEIQAHWHRPCGMAHWKANAAACRVGGRCCADPFPRCLLKYCRSSPAKALWTSISHRCYSLGTKDFKGNCSPSPTCDFI